jgi:hypothetical protein
MRPIWFKPSSRRSVRVKGSAENAVCHSSAGHPPVSSLPAGAQRSPLRARTRAAHRAKRQKSSSSPRMRSMPIARLPPIRRRSPARRFERMPRSHWMPAFDNYSVRQPNLALCGFKRVYLREGQPERVSLEIPAARLRISRRRGLR